MSDRIHFSQLKGVECANCDFTETKITDMNLNKNSL